MEKFVMLSFFRGKLSVVCAVVASLHHGVSLTSFQSGPNFIKKSYQSFWSLPLSGARLGPRRVCPESLFVGFYYSSPLWPNTNCAESRVQWFAWATSFASFLETVFYKKCYRALVARCVQRLAVSSFYHAHWLHINSELQPTGKRMMHLCFARALPVSLPVAVISILQRMCKTHLFCPKTTNVYSALFPLKQL